MSDTYPKLSLTVIKHTDNNPPKGSPSVSINFQGEPMTAADQRLLIECLVNDLVRKIEDRDAKIGNQYLDLATGTVDLR